MALADLIMWVLAEEGGVERLPVQWTAAASPRAGCYSAPSYLSAVRGVLC